MQKWSQRGTQGGIAAVVLWDLMKCYEHVRRAKLWKHGVELGYPLAQLRLSLRSYAWRRYLRIEGMVGKEIYARRGIVAGHSFATTELKVYMIKEVKANAEVFARRSLNIHVHVYDIAIEKEGEDGDEVEKDIVEAAEDLGRRLERELHLPLAVEKGAIVASNEKVADGIAVKLGIKGGSVKDATRNLGVDTTAGRSLRSGGRRRTCTKDKEKPPEQGRGKTKQKKENTRGKQKGEGKAEEKRRKPRITVLKERARKSDAQYARLRRLRAKGTAGKVFFAGPLRAGTYGAEIWGITPNRMHKLRVQAGGAMGISGKGRSLDMAWLLMGQRRDPQQTAWSPMVRWAKEIWWASTIGAGRPGGVIPFHQLMKMGADRWGFMSPNSHSHRKINGPISAMFSVAQKVGWTVLKPDEFANDQGHIINFRVSPPKVVEAWLMESWERRQENNIIENLVDKVGTGNSEGGKHENKELREKGIWIEPIRQALKNPRGSLSTGERNKLVNLIMGAAVDVDTLERWGYEADPVCGFCGERDTTWHRVYRCSHGEEARRRYMDPKWTKKAEEEGERSIGFKYGIFPRPECEDQLAEDQCKTWRLQRNAYGEVERAEMEGDEDQDILFNAGDGPMASDGSLLEPRHGRLQKGGWAAIQCDHEGKFLKGMCGTIKREPRMSSTLLEHLAFHQLAIRIDGGGDVLIDNAAVVARGKASRADQTGAKSFYAGFWRDIHSVRKGRGQEQEIGCIKIKAHVKQEDTKNRQERVQHAANEQADYFANHANSTHQHEASIARQWKKEYEEYIEFLRAVGRILDQWPSMRELSGKLKKKERRGEEESDLDVSKLKMSHQWFQTGRRWTCRVCQRTTAAIRPGAASWVGGECKARQQGILRVLEPYLGHSLVAVAMISGVVMMACTACGAYATHRPKLLGRHCMERVTMAGRRALENSFIKRRHPCTLKKGVFSEEEIPKKIQEGMTAEKVVQYNRQRWREEQERKRKGGTGGAIEEAGAEKKPTEEPTEDNKLLQDACTQDHVTREDNKLRRDARLQEGGVRKDNNFCQDGARLQDCSAREDNVLWNDGAHLQDGGLRYGKELSNDGVRHQDCGLQLRQGGRLHDRVPCEEHKPHQDESRKNMSSPNGTPCQNDTLRQNGLPRQVDETCKRKEEEGAPKRRSEERLEEEVERGKEWKERAWRCRTRNRPPPGPRTAQGAQASAWREPEQHVEAE